MPRYCPCAGWMRSSNLLDSAPDAVWRRRHVDMLYTQRRQRVTDRVDDRAAGADGSRFTHTLDAKLVERRGCDCAVELVIEHLVRGRDHVVDERSRPQLSGLGVIHDLFEQRLAQALGDAALDLAVDYQRIDDIPAVV